MAGFSLVAPRRVKTRHSAGKAAASEETRRYVLQFVWAVRRLKKS
jgi:hypothetical protein